jgi:hypothetical protein
MAAVSLFGANQQAGAASDAAGLQSDAAMAGLQLQREQMEKLREILKPYTDAGIGGVTGMQEYAKPGLVAMNKQADLAGIHGPEAQRAAVAEISASPELQAMMQQGENAMLQNASATGGLRGGNLQGALAQFRPSMLNQAISQRYGQLGGFANMGLGVNQNIAQLGQASAAGVGTAGLQAANNQGNLLAQMGAAQAGGALGGANAWRGLGSDLFRLGGMGGFDWLNKLGQRTGGNWNPADDGFTSNPFGGA